MVCAAAGHMLQMWPGSGSAPLLHPIRECGAVTGDAGLGMESANIATISIYAVTKMFQVELTTLVLKPTT